ncbi:MAG: fasciclin domain-containing protein [Pseudoclavibacter sp.]
MRTFTTMRPAALLAIAGVSMLGLAACSGSGMGESPANTEDMGATTAPDETTTDGMDEGMDPAANLVGAGCADYAEQVPDGPGSVAGMSQDPVAVAASNNPMLTMLTSAVSGELNPEVDLVSTLNDGEYTVFAPVDDAFAMIDDATLDTLSTDAEMLTSILTYHVVEGQVLPDALPGEHATMQGEMVTVTGSDDELMVNGGMVICGGVQTANATVYLVDTVLMPPSMS